MVEECPRHERNSWRRAGRCTEISVLCAIAFVDNRTASLIVNSWFSHVHIDQSHASIRILECTVIRPHSDVLQFVNLLLPLANNVAQNRRDLLDLLRSVFHVSCEFLACFMFVRHGTDLVGGALTFSHLYSPRSLKPRSSSLSHMP